MENKLHDLKELYLIVERMNKLAHKRDAIDSSIRDRAFTDDEYVTEAKLQEEIDSQRKMYIQKRKEFASRFFSVAEVEEMITQLERKKQTDMETKGFYDLKKYSEIAGILHETKMVVKENLTQNKEQMSFENIENDFEEPEIR